MSGFIENEKNIYFINTILFSVNKKNNKYCSEECLLLSELDISVSVLQVTWFVVDRVNGRACKNKENSEYRKHRPR